VPIRLLIADDHRLILRALHRVLATADDIEIVAEARRGSQVLPLLHQHEPDVCLLDLHMPEMDGLTCVDRIRKAGSDVRVVMLTAANEPERANDAFARGADGYISKSVDPVDLADAVRRVHSGERVELGLADSTASHDDAGLTERETSILQAVARGLSNQAISKECWITEQTVKFHLTNIYRKLGVKNRTEATRYAYQHGLADELAVV
jgi:DNA-binding NarL/FixJ family response regulator